MKLIFLVILIIIAIIFISIIQKLNNLTYKGSKEYITSDVIDDDIDDHYQENDWDDTLWDVNDFEDNNYLYEIDDDVVDMEI